MNIENKLWYFEYTIHLFYKWHKEATGKEENDLGKLKVNKLLYFLSAVKNLKSRLLDDLYNNFHGMPYGHIEYDIFKFLNQTKIAQLNYYSIDIKQTTFNTIIDTEKAKKIKLQTSIINEINSSLELLKKKNYKIITFAPFDLVDLSQAHYSWQTSYSIWKKYHDAGKSISTLRITPEAMKEEHKIYSLSIF